jgi:hypothetical protein
VYCVASQVTGCTRNEIPARRASRATMSDVGLVIAEDDPLRPDVTALLERHLAFAHEVTPEGSPFADYTANPHSVCMTLMLGPGVSNTNGVLDGPNGVS